MLVIKITDKDKFSNITKVNLDNLKPCVSPGIFTGDIIVECEEFGIDYVHSGRHGLFDFEDKYGFIIIENE